MKNIYILLIFICSMANVQAQNSELAKAFYTKAETAYKANNFYQALQLIENCKEQLNGETNPEIMYLEAKARYVHDLNINETKRLMNNFIKEAFEDDERVKEIAGLLADIELSKDLYYPNGDKSNHYKIIYFPKNENIIWMIDYFNERGKLFFSVVFDAWNSLDNDNPVFSLEYFDYNGGRTQTVYIRGNDLYLKAYLNGNKVKLTKNKATSDFGYKIEVLETYDFNHKILDEHKKKIDQKIAKIKKVKIDLSNNSEERYFIVNFNEQGITQKRILFENGIEKETEIFDLNSKQWVNQ